MKSLYTNLKDCLFTYEKSKLIGLADKQHLIVNLGEPIIEEELIKKEIVDSLAAQIAANFYEDLFYIPPRELGFLIKVMEMDFSPESHVNYEDCSFLLALGYIYLYDINGRVYPIIPKELRRIYGKISKKELEDKIKESQELYSYSIALVRLYQIYPVEQFVEVWNAHHQEHISLEDASMYFYMMYDRQIYFKYDYEYVVSSHFENDEGYQQLDKMKDKPYYIPTEDEIRAYSKEPFELILPLKQDLVEFM